MNRWLSASSGLVLALFLVGCSNAPVRPYQDDEQTRHRSEAEERMWFAAGQIDEGIRKRRMLYQAEDVQGYVQSLLDGLYPEFNGIIRVRLLDSPRLNAFTLPNGSIYLNIGLLGRMENEAQLATVLAHEASHFIHQHSLQQRNSSDGAMWVGVGFELLTGIPFTGNLLTQGILTGHSHAHENEADEEGFKRLVDSGYDPAEALATFRLLQQEVETLGIDEPFMFSSHPKLSQRVASFDRLIAESGLAGGVRNEQRFLTRTSQVRGDILDRYLKLHSYKTLLLMLESDASRKRYPAYARYYLGEAYRLRGEEGDDQRAMAAYEMTLQDAPDFAPPHKSIGLMMLKWGDQAGAGHHFLRYLELTPEAEDRLYIQAHIDRPQGL